MKKYSNSPLKKFATMKSGIIKIAYARTKKFAAGKLGVPTKEVYLIKKASL